jgi:hypothetical protein
VNTLTDLRWNNLGILGGRDISDAMKWNYSLVDLELGGNDINEEAIHAVDIALVRNREAQSAKSREQAKAVMLQNELELLKRSQSDQLRVLEKQRNEFATIVIYLIKKQKPQSGYFFSISLGLF